MASRKLLFVNSNYEYEEEQASVASTSGVADAGKFINLDVNGKLDQSFLPDAIVNGYDWKESVRAVTKTNVSLSAPGAAFDGVTLASGDRVLLAGQTAAAENGIYVFDSASTALVRSEDANTNAEVTSGNRVYISEGTTCAEQVATLTTNDPIVLDTTALTYVFQSTESLTGGDGIDITAGVVSADLVADGGIEFVSGQMQVKFADTSVSADMDGTNGLHAISAQDLSSNGANQGANILGFDPSNCATITATNIQAALDQVCALAESGSAVSFTVGTGGVSAGDLVYISGNDTILPLPITGTGSENFGIGIATTTVAASGSVNVSPNDSVMTGVLTGATAGELIFWDGSALTSTAPTANDTTVWQVGRAKNATDLYIDVNFIKRNCA